MDQFISTYQRDYTWPSSRIQHARATLREGGSCRCDTSSSRELKVIELCGDEQDWSRVGPMGRLLDPKLYPEKAESRPKADKAKSEQTSTYIKKLEETYPNLYGILQATPMAEIEQRVDKDRLRTTYQIDFSEKATVGVSEGKSAPCISTRKPEKDDCHPSARSRFSKRDEESQKGKTKKEKKKGEEDSQETRIPPWRSEYQDNISRLGNAIMRGKMHSKKNASPAWAMAVL